MSCKCGTNPTILASNAVLELLTGTGAKKHADKWKTRSDQDDMNHAEIHKVKYFSDDYPDYDHETGTLHLVHMIARLQFVLQRRMMRDLYGADAFDEDPEDKSPVEASPVMDDEYR